MELKKHLIATLLIAAGAGIQADIITTTPIQVGGFYDTGGIDNLPSHQNYYVGYGTVGGVRSTERRSFFWYHIPSFSGDVVDVTIRLKMLVTTSLVFGISPGDPTVHDTIEKFQLGATSLPASVMTDPTLTPTAADAVFDVMDDFPIAPTYDFVAGSIPSVPFAVEIHLGAAGLGLVSGHRGADVVFTGWMPTWSYDARTDGMGHWLEGDELLFGFSDIPGLVPAPELTIYTVPEHSALLPMLFGISAMGLCALVRRKRLS